MKNLLFLSVLSLSGLLYAAPGEKMPPPPIRERRNVQGGDPRLQRHLWRAFAELSDSERKEMIQLQRNDPEKFRLIMQKKVEKIIREERETREKLANFAKMYQAAQNNDEKEVIRKQTRKIMQERFQKRLISNRRQLEAMKRRAEQLEKELDKRAASKDKIIDLQVEAILSGKKPPFAPGKHRGPGRPHPHNRRLEPQK